ncbi:hypothetical protein [Entomobacter blattae]|nr:hypothetical protein [Entomobacter blattae]QNT78169.1 hypothetical protein JGUZn3_09380 [Entomobacter blattae]
MQAALKAIGHEKDGPVSSTLCRLFAVWAGKRKVELLVGVGISLLA